MVNFLGCPYIDLRVDFNSFFAKRFKRKFKEKIVNYSLNKVNKYPELHDKIEFDLIETFLILIANLK